MVTTAHRLWVLAKDDGAQIVFAVGRNAMEAWEAGVERVWGEHQDTDTALEVYTRRKAQMHGDGWRARPCTLTVGPHPSAKARGAYQRS